MSALEESIGSSPKRCRRSIHEKRLKRKLKRRRLNETLSSTLNHSSNQLEDGENDWSRLLYAEDTQPTKSTQLENQMPLAAADRMSSRTLPAVKRDHIEVSQGFRKVEDLPVRGKSFDGSESIACSQVVKVEALDDITESELLHVCEQVENYVKKSGSTLETPRAKHTKSIVDLILEDFCASPLTPDTHTKLIRPAEDTTPTFRFRHQPLRTYSRRRRLDVTGNVPEAPLIPEIEEANGAETPLIPKIEEDCMSSSSSNLSLEERLPVVAPDTVEELEHSESFCNNLLNLSLFFTESPPKAAAQPAHVESSEELGLASQTATEPPTDFAALLSGTINEIIDLRQQYPLVFSKRQARSRNCRGFKCADDEVSADLESTLTPPTVDIVVPETEEVEADIQELEPVIAAAISAPEFEFEIPLAVEMAAQVKTVPSAPKEVCDNNLSETPPLTKNEDIFSENGELWDEDLDFFKNFKTQEILPPKSTLGTSKRQHEELPSNGTPTDFVVGFKTASRKTIHVSKEAQQRAAKLLQDLPALNGKVESKEPVVQELYDPGVSKIDDDKDCSAKTGSVQNPTPFVGFETASRKAISVSKEARERAASILQHLPELNGKIASDKRQLGVGSNKQTFNSEIPTTSKGSKLPNAVAVNGCQPATYKAIDKEALKRPDFPALNGIKRPEALIDDGRPSTSKAASLRQCNSRTEEQQQAAVNSIFPELPNEIENLAPAPEVYPEAATFVGFRTASHKTIQVSESARKKALSILSKLPEIPNAVENPTPPSPAKPQPNPLKLSADINAQVYFDEVLKNVQFSEWPLSNESPCGKRPLSALDEVDNVQPLKPSKCLMTHKPVALKSSLSDLAVHSPLSTTATQSIIARSNLLSLSKRRKSRKTSFGADGLQETTTPNKVHSLADHQEPTTPNLQQFFSAIGQAGTSTPIAQLDRAKLEQTAHKELERDFRHIDWEDCADLSDKSDATLRQTSNVSKASSNTTPTAQQRIERLLIYPEPPPVSPIAMAKNTKCRRLGLQRSRNASKRSEL